MCGCARDAGGIQETLRLIYRGTTIYAGNYTAESAGAALRNGWPLNVLDPNRFFGGTAAGYTDYSSRPPAKQNSVREEAPT